MAREKKRGRKKASENKPEKDLTEFTPEEASREDIIGFRGGIPIDLSQVDDQGVSLREKLSAHISGLLEQELQNHGQVIDSLRKWQKQYQGKKDPKGFPYQSCANVAVPITRSNVDTIHVRVQDALFNKRKVFICRARSPEFVGIDRQIEEFLDWFVRNVLRLKEKTSDPLLQATKMGSGWGMWDWVQKTRTVYRYANDMEKEDKSVTKYQAESGDVLVKELETLYSGPDFFPISREDIVYSSDATNIADAYMFGFRKYYREAQLQLKVRQGLYNADSVSAVTAPDKIDETKISRAANQGLDLKKVRYEEPYEVWVLYLKYDVDDDGQEDDIVISFHRGTNQILRAIYNPLFYGSRPFTVFKGLPIEFSLEGEGLCSVLEKLQEEIDTIRNQRLDRNTLGNAPMSIVRSGAGIDDFKIFPGKTWFTNEDPKSVIAMIEFGSSPIQNYQEEDRLIAQADRACGIYPESMGLSTSERPVAKEALVRAEEANKKFKAIIENYRQAYIDGGYQIIEFFAQYQPTYTYRSEVGGQMQEKTINFPLSMIRDGLEIELFASTEMMSQEVRREVNMTVYGLLTDFKTKAAGMVQALVNPMVPSFFKLWSLAEYDSSRKETINILHDFDIRDAESMIVDLNGEEFQEAIQKCIANSIDLRPPMPPPGGLPGGGGTPPGPGGPPMGPPIM